MATQRKTSRNRTTTTAQRSQASGADRRRNTSARRPTGLSSGSASAGQRRRSTAKVRVEQRDGIWGLVRPWIPLVVMVLLILLLLFCVMKLVTCAGHALGGRQDQPQEEQVVEQPEKEEEKKADSKIAVTIDGATLGQDYDGNPAVIVTYTFTNVSSENAESFLVACYAQVYQNGVECEYAYVPDLEGDSSTNVKAGASYTLQQAYKVSDTSPIEVEVRESFSFDNTPIATATFKFE